MADRAVGQTRTTPCRFPAIPLRDRARRPRHGVRAADRRAECRALHGATAVRKALAARDCTKAGVVTRGISNLNAVADTSYAPCGDLSLAYQVFGDGPVELVVVGPFVSHIELAWTLPQFKAFVEQLATFCRVLMFDKAGVGLSDPVPKVRTLEDRAAEIEAVMDAVGFGEAVVSGLSDGGPAAMMFAATRPARVRALILAGTVPYWGFAGWDDMDRDPAELRARFLAELGEDYTPSIEQLARFQEGGRAVRSGGAAVRQPASARRRSGRYASSRCVSG